MANFIAIADGNLTDASTWATTSTAGNLITTNNSFSACGTTDRDSATFVLAASDVQYVAVKLYSRASGTPTNTITIHLRNSTTSTNVLSWTLNVSDLPSAGYWFGGWIVLRASSAHTPNGTDSYLIRTVMSATTTAVSLFTNGTAYNWQRMIGLTTTGAPGAGDDMHIAGWFDNTNNPATFTNRTVTQNCNTATDYGSASTSSLVPALTISKGGTLTWPTNANSLLQLSGFLSVFIDGTYSQGTTSSRIQAGYTATMQFDCGADNQFGLGNAGGTVNICGVNKTKSWTLLTADAAISATTLTTADATGWKDGDSIYIASTTQTLAQHESRTLSGDASGTTITISSGLTYAHDGNTTTKYQAEVINVTRSAIFKSATSYYTQIRCYGNASLTVSWAKLDKFGSEGFNLESSVTTAVVEYCSFVNCTGYIFYTLFLTGTLTANYNVIYGSSMGSLFYFRSMGAWTINYNVALATDTNSTNLFLVNYVNSGMSLTGNRMAGGNLMLYTYYSIGEVGPPPITLLSDCVIHGTGGGIKTSDYNCYNITYNNIFMWRLQSGGSGITIGYNNHSNVIFNDCSILGGCDNSLHIFGPANNIRFNNCTFASENGYHSDRGIYLRGFNSYGPVAPVIFENCSFGVVTGNYIAYDWELLRGDGSPYTYCEIYFRGTDIGGNTTISAWSEADQNYLSRIHYSYNGSHFTRTSFGKIERDTSTVGGVTPLIKLTPNDATYKLKSHGEAPRGGLLIPVQSGDTPDIVVAVRKTAAYNGNAPRLIARTHSEMGIDSDTVLDTLSVAADTWEDLTYSFAAAPQDGFYEVFVDCDGTAGSVYIGGVTVDGNTYSHDYWEDGLPVLVGSAGAPGASGGSYPFFGVL